jgi:hypothetical protein
MTKQRPTNSASRSCLAIALALLFSGRLSAGEQDKKAEKPIQTPADELIDVLTGKSPDPRLQRQLTQVNKEVRTLMQEKRAAAQAAFAAMVKENRGALDLYVLDASKRLVDADLEMAKSPQERGAAWERHWLLAKKCETETAAARARLRYVIHELRYYRLEAEIGYVAEKKALEKAGSTVPRFPERAPPAQADQGLSFRDVEWLGKRKRELAQLNKDARTLLQEQRDAARACHLKFPSLRYVSMILRQFYTNFFILWSARPWAG